MAHKKATEDQFNAACDWLKSNDISGIAFEGTALDKLAAVIPQVDPELVQSRLYGKRH